MPPAETKLWEHLRKKQLKGYKFRRQHGIDQYIVDFYCSKVKLAIEVDGPSHFMEKSKDSDRQRMSHIESLGIRVLRFNNQEIYNNLDGVVNRILEFLPD